MTVDEQLISDNKKRKELLERRMERLENLIREDLENQLNREQSVETHNEMLNRRVTRLENLVRRYRNR